MTAQSHWVASSSAAMVLILTVHLYKWVLVFHEEAGLEGLGQYLFFTVVFTGKFTGKYHPRKTGFGYQNWKMPGNHKFDPFHKVKIAPQLEKSTNYDYNLISSEGGQDTSACKISAHSLHAFSRKCPETYPDGVTDERTGKKRSRLVGPMYKRKEGISVLGQTDNPKT